MGHLVTLDPLAAISLLWTAGAGVEKLLHLGLISATRWRGLALDRTGLLLAVRADRFSFLFAAAKTLFNAVSCCREIRLKKLVCIAMELFLRLQGWRLPASVGLQGGPSSLHSRQVSLRHIFLVRFPNPLALGSQAGTLSIFSTRMEESYCNIDTQC